MEKLHRNIWASFERPIAKSFFSRRKDGPMEWVCGEVSNAKIRKSAGRTVGSFQELVGRVAELASFNPWVNLYYRGQKQDHRDKNGRSKIYAPLYRPKVGKANLQPATINKRIESLNDAIQRMRKRHRALGLPTSVLADHDEYYQALLQHYELRKTPLVDVTVSLRVAASFALADDAPEGFLFAIHLPLPTGSISHFIDENMVLVRLQSVCPSTALRPHYQEGYLVGQLRHKAQKLKDDNLAKRIVEKYRLDNSTGRFWNTDFPPIPKEALLPSDDRFGKRLRDMLSGFPPAE